MGFCACATPADLPPPAPQIDDAAHVGGKGDGYGDGEVCTITLCLTGAMNHQTPSNTFFREMCEDPRIEGVHFDCHGEVCNSTFDSFLQFPLLTVYPALTDALDRNGDGRVDGQDPVCHVNLIGFSWGGVNALSVAGHLNRDQSIPKSHRRVRHAVLLDAFQPLSAGRMTVPENVDSVLSMRHSIAPDDDCSRGAPLGPYLGFAPRCGSGQDCQDYDYSLAPETLFRDARGWSVWGDGIGHCHVPGVAHENVVSFVNDRPMTDRLPPRTTD